MSVLILAPDGVLRDSVSFTTTIPQRFITGTVPEGTVDILVSVRGGGYTSDPSMVLFQGTSFTVPNPTSFPNGLELYSGTNEIGIQAIPLTGSLEAPSVLTAYLTTADDGSLFQAPTGITIERLDRSVRVSVQGLTDSRVTGYQFYAASESGGGSLGYARLNVQPVVAFDTVESTTALYDLVSKNPTGDETPVYVRATLQLENEDAEVLTTMVNTRAEVPDTVTDLETRVVISALTTTTFYRFVHNRQATETSVPPTIFVGDFASLDPALPLYYVVTAVYFDPATRTEYESFFSPEVVGSPVNVRIQTTGLPAVSRRQILQDAIESIYRQDADMSVQPGAVLRDTFLDPFSTEAERWRFLLDFLYRASSFDTLLQIDDPNGTGTSISPDQSAYKQALAAAFFLSNVQDVQPIIDGAFEKLAANVGVSRPPGKRALGEARFFTSSLPTRTLSIALGTVVLAGGIQFRTTRAAEIPLDQLASYYNPSTRQYSVTVPIQAFVAGSAGNISARQINSGAPFGLGVTNDSGTFGGQDEYSNTQLAAFARGALAGTDTGTAQGLQKVAREVAGVVQTEVVRAGDPLMQRDLDSATGRHVGGKVDIWSQGLRGAQVSDVFAFTYVRRRNVQFVVVGDPALLQFQALDPGLSNTNPLAAMLDVPALGLGLRNATTGVEYDLTGATVITYNTIRLDSTLVQPPVALTDVVLGDYRYRTGDQYVFSRQPVSYISSVIGEVTGALSPQSFYLAHPNSPLGLGRSTRAGDYLQVVQATGPDVITPSGGTITVTDEAHVLTGFYTENLFVLGADSLTLEVTDPTGLVTYKGPFDPSGLPDYEIVEGTQTSPLGIRRTQDSDIADGSSVLVSYVHDENFVVTYQTNLVTSAVQAALDVSEHATGDVLAKDAFPVPADMTMTVVLDRGAQQSTVDPAIRSNIRFLLINLRMGTALRRSDVIAAVNNTPGVSYVVVPLTVLSRAANSLVARDDIASQGLGDTRLIPAWSNNEVCTWLLRQELDCPTTVGGGPTGVYRAVFQDDVPLTLQLSNPAGLGAAVGLSYIIGDDGQEIPGYTDLATLISEGYVTEADQDNARRLRTQNRVLVTTRVGDSPVSHTYWATYQVGYSRGEQDITPSTVEYVVPGNITFTYVEAR